MEKTEKSMSNIPEFSVSELAFSLKQTLETNFAHVRVRGELSKVSLPASGHLYTALKDGQALIDAVCWKGNLSKLSIKPEEGLEVICTGRISTYPVRSNYQLIIESMELSGEGELLKLLEKRKQQLASEGLFDEQRKKPLPFLPQKIGVITSPTGAVIKDILHRLSDRFPRDVLLWPVKVQGEGAAQEIERAILGFSKLDNPPDLLIVARGGGSMEDLMPFNEEIVVRAVAQSDIPIISAVGHETDTTLIDYASDLRAPTPTGAAEIAVPVRVNLLAQVLDDEHRLLNAMGRIVEEYAQKIRTCVALLGTPEKLIEVKTQHLDHMGENLTRIYYQSLIEKNAHVTQLASGLLHPMHIVKQAKKDLERISTSLKSLPEKITLLAQQNLTHAAKMLEAFSFENILERGFVVVRNSEGGLITDYQLALKENMVSLQFKENNHVSAVIKKDKESLGFKEQSTIEKDSSKEEENSKQKNPSRSIKNKTSGEQTELF